MFNRLTDNQKVVLQAIDDNAADLGPLEKFITKTAVRRNPSLADDAVGYARAKAESEGLGALGDGELLKYIIEHLPEIAAFIAAMFKLFGGLCLLVCLSLPNTAQAKCLGCSRVQASVYVAPAAALPRIAPYRQFGLHVTRTRIEVSRNPINRGWFAARPLRSVAARIFIRRPFR